MMREDICSNCGHEQDEDDELWQYPAICDLCLED
jgi:hypothetical protein